MVRERVRVREGVKVKAVEVVDAVELLQFSSLAVVYNVTLPLIYFLCSFGQGL